MFIAFNTNAATVMFGPKLSKDPILSVLGSILCMFEVVAVLPYDNHSFPTKSHRISVSVCRKCWNWCSAKQ